MQCTRVMIAEDNALYRQGLAGLLSEIEGVSIIGTAPDGASLLQLIEEKEPEVVFTDIQMPIMDGIELTKILSSRFSKIKVLALTQFVEADLITSMLEAGAKGYLTKSSALDELHYAIKVVKKGLHYYCPYTSEQLSLLLIQSQQREQFTTKEREIIRMICEGYVSKQIAPLVFLSENTVEKYRTRIMQKAGVRGRLGLIAFAVRNNLYQTEIN